MHNSVYERINPVSQASLLTTSVTEASNAGARYGFSTNKGTPFQASSVPAAGLTTVVRLYNAHSSDFLWTTSANEVRSATSHYGYTVMSSKFYAATSRSTCDVPVYRYQRASHHRFTTSASERTALVAAGWKYEGIGFYGAPATGATQPPSSSSSSSASKPVTSSSASSTSHSSAPTSSSAPATSTHSTPPSPTSPSKSAPTSSQPPATGQGPLSRPLYVPPSGTGAGAAYQAATDPTVKRALYQIAATPAAIWLGGASTDESRVNQIETAANSQGKTPVFVLYAIPFRDCGNYSAGGIGGTSQYEAWVDSVRRGIAGRPAVVIAEPDAIGWGCLSASRQADRIAMLKYDLQTLSQDPNTWVYVHAGSSGLNPSDVAKSLKQIGIEYARGFAVNVSSFDSTSSEIAYGKAIDAALGMQKHFVIDTSRNGMGRYTGNDGAPAWCNPPGRAVGSRPTTQTSDPLADAYLWIKVPGGSDGNCRAGDPPAGQFYTSYAVDLVQRAVNAGIIENWALPKS